MASTYSIFDFLRNCSGNWRNTLYVPCGFCSHPCRAKQRGVLVTADGYGRPQAISVVRYEAITGQRIDPDECVGTLRQYAFVSGVRVLGMRACGRLPSLPPGQRNNSRAGTAGAGDHFGAAYTCGRRGQAIKTVLCIQTQGVSQVSASAQPDAPRRSGAPLRPRPSPPRVMLKRTFV